MRLLRKYAERHDIEVVAYCLMSNHVHLVVVPKREGSLPRAVSAVHGQYAQHVNKTRDQKGHVWQGRFFSSSLDSNYFVNAVRYVELNPVRAGLVTKAEDYGWSSAPAHCGLCVDPVIASQPRSSNLASIPDWSQWLAEGDTEELLTTLRKHGSQNLPCGSPEFIDQLEKASGRPLRYRHAGREPAKEGIKGDSHL